MSQNLIKIYNQSYLQKYHQTPGRRLKNILSHVHLDTNDIVLDAGCGNALLYKLIKNKVKKYYGVDFSQDFINFFQKKYQNHNTEFACRDLIEFCKEKYNFFDKIFMLDFTEHVPDQELSDILKSARASLRKGGILYIHTPNKNYFLEILKDKKIMDQTTGHVAVRSAEEYLKLLQKAGFYKIESVFLPHYNFLRHFDFLKHAPLLGKYNKARLLLIARL